MYVLAEYSPYPHRIHPLKSHEHKLEKLQQLNAPEEEIAHKHEQITSYLVNGLVYTGLMCIFSLVLLVPCIAFLDRFGQEPEVVACARPYYTLIVLSIIPFLLFCFSKQFLEGLDNTWVAMLITLGCNLLNIALNWVFIYGHWGLPPMGAYGAGLASLIATGLMPVLFIGPMWWRREWREYVLLFSTRLFSRATLRQLMKVGFPIGLQTTMETILFTLSFIMVGWISKEALAAHHIANNIADCAFLLSLGVGSATTIRVSHQYGLRDWHALRMASRASIHLILLMNTIGASLMIGLRNYIPYLYSDDPVVIAIASPLLVYAGLFQYADGLQCVGAGMLRGVTDVRRPMLYSILSYGVIALPLGYVLMFPLGLGVEGMWISFIVALTLVAILFLTRYYRRLNRLM